MEPRFSDCLQSYLYQIIGDQYSEDDKNMDGFFPVSMPTGSGKSYTSRQVIASLLPLIKKENSKMIFNDQLNREIEKIPLQKRKKIFFMSPMKKNLDIDDFKKNDLMKNDVLFLDNNLETVKSFFLNTDKNFVDYLVLPFKKNKEIFDPLKQKLSQLRDCVLRHNSLIDISSETVDVKSILDNTEREIYEIRNSIAKILRTFFKNAFNNENDKKKLKDNHEIYESELIKIKYNFIDNNAVWLLKLFPEINYFRKNIILLTVKKFCYPFKTIIDNTITNISLNKNDKNLLRNSFIFIDEVNLIKKELFSFLSEMSTNYPIDFFSFVQNCYYQALHTTDTIYYTELYTTHDVYKNEPIYYYFAQNHDYKYRIDVQNKRILAKCKKYHVNNNFKLNLNEKSDSLKKSAIFELRKPLYLKRNDINKVFLNIDSNKGYNWINIYDRNSEEYKKAQKNEIKLQEFIYDTQNMINFISNYINTHEKTYPLIPNSKKGLEDISLSYKDLNDKKNRYKYQYNLKILKEKGNISTDETTMSFISNLVNKDKDLIKVFFNSHPFKSGHFHGKFGFQKEQIDSLSYYSKGVAYYTIEEDKSSKDQDKFNQYNLWTSPENLFLSLIKNNLVIGLGATANIESFLCNMNQNVIATAAEKNEIKKLDFTKEQLQNLKKLYKEEIYTNEDIYEFEEIVSHNTREKIITANKKNKTEYSQILYNYFLNTKLDLNDLNIKNYVYQFLSNYFEIFFNDSCSAYDFARYINHLELFINFLRHPCLQNILVFNNALPKNKSDTFSLQILKNLYSFADILIQLEKVPNLGYLSQSYVEQHYNNVVVLNSENKVDTNGTKIYDYSIKKVKETLENYSKVVVLTSYATCETAVNLDHHAVISDLSAFVFLGKKNINLTDDEKSYLKENVKRYQTVDMNAIALFDLTHILPAVSGDSDKEKNLSVLKALAVCEEFKAEGANESFIEMYESINIKNNLEQDKSENSRIKLKRALYSNFRDIRNCILNTFIQATGRLCRSYCKYKKTKLYYVDLYVTETNNFEDLRYSDTIHSPIIQSFINYLNGKLYKDDKKQFSKDQKYYLECNKELNTLNKWGSQEELFKWYFQTNYLKNIRESENSPEKENLIKNYNSLREFAVKHPTMVNSEKDTLASESSSFNTSEADIPFYAYFKTDNGLFNYEFNFNVFNYSNFDSKNAFFRVELKADKLYFPRLPINIDEEYTAKRNEYVADFKGVSIDAESCKFYELIKNKTVYNYFQDKGVACKWHEKPDYIMSPTMFYIYIGRIGELAGEAIFNKYFSDIFKAYNVKLKEIEPEHFEFFDYKLTDRIFIDFKWWKGPIQVSQKEFEDNIVNKAETIRNSYIKDKTKNFSDKDIIHIFIINILPMDEKYSDIDEKMLNPNIKLHLFQRLINPNDIQNDDLKSISRLQNQLTTVLRL